MITNTGIGIVRDWIKDGNGSPPTNIGTGLGTTSPTVSDTALTNEVYPTTSRSPATITKTEDVIHFEMITGTTDGSTAAYAENGLFTNSTTGTMFSHQTHPDANKDVNKVMVNIISVEVGSYLP